MVGRLELEAGNVDSAVDELTRCLAKDPEFTPAYLGLAAAHTRREDLPAVAENLRQYLARQPDHQFAHLYLAECCLRLGEHEQARAHYRQYLAGSELESRSLEQAAQRRMRCHLRLAALAEEEGDAFASQYHAGLFHWERATAGREIPLAAGDREAARSDGFGIEQREDLVAALDCLRTAKGIRPDDPGTRAALAAVLAALGQEPARIADPSEKPQPGMDLDILADDRARESKARERVSSLILGPDRAPGPARPSL